MMITGPAVTVMVTSTIAVALASPLPSSAVTVTTYVSCVAISKVTPVATVIWPLSASMLNEPESAPERLYVSMAFVDVRGRHGRADVVAGLGVLGDGARGRRRGECRGVVHRG